MLLKAGAHGVFVAKFDVRKLLGPPGERDGKVDARDLWCRGLDESELRGRGTYPRLGLAEKVAQLGLVRGDLHAHEEGPGVSRGSSTGGGAGAGAFCCRGFEIIAVDSRVRGGGGERGGFFARLGQGEEMGGVILFLLGWGVLVAFSSALPVLAFLLFLLFRLFPVGLVCGRGECAIGFSRFLVLGGVLARAGGRSGDVGFVGEVGDRRG
jgi:hypothetical protein